MTASLLSIPAPGISAIELGPLTIHIYALCIIAGVIAALWLGSRRWAARGGPEGTVLDIALWAIPFGLIGARIYHVLTSPDVYFGPGFDGTGDPIKVFFIWEGGIGIMGAISGGAIGAWIACRRAGVRLSAFADVVAPGILLAQAIGRWGNYFNQELFGRPTDLPWALHVDADHYNFPASLAPGTTFHPTFLYESLWSLVGVGVLLLIDKRFRLRRGAMLFAYVIWYTAGRIWMETFRIDVVRSYTLVGLEMRLHAWIALAILVFGVVGLIVSLLRQRGLSRAERDDLYLPGRAPVEPAVSATAETTDSSAAPQAVAAEDATHDPDAHPVRRRPSRPHRAP
ncbi:MAG: prolipoprotein diacylglyceryl transferase [Micrococcus sp.]|nr:prolipoprotein diacylglyceryl transferase [Micrococcus sp.]